MASVPDKSGNAPVGFAADNKYSWANRTAANVAGVIALTPLYPGEIVRALDTGFQYMGSALVAGAWVYVDSLASHGA